jgi:hypothetical protein
MSVKLWSLSRRTWRIVSLSTEEYCDIGIEMMRRQDIKVEEGQRDKFLRDLRCSKCGGDSLELKFERNLHTGYIRCKDCGNFDTREFVDGKPGDLVKCDLCGSSTTEIVAEKGYSYPNWIHTKFDYIDNMILCKKCDKECIKELEQKDIEIKNKSPTIEYMFDGDELKYWRKGDNDELLGKIEIDCDNGKNRYERALEEMKSRFQKRTRFIDIDEE